MGGWSPPIISVDRHGCTCIYVYMYVNDICVRLLFADMEINKYTVYSTQV